MSKIGALISRTWGVDQSVVDTTPIVTYIAGSELRVENHGGIETLTETEIAFGNKIRIFGENLTVEWIEKDMIVVNGEISTITFERN